MIDENLVINKLEAETNYEVLDCLSNLLYENGYVKESYKQAVKDREKDFPTGLLIEDGFGIAIPHADREHVNRIGMAVATLDDPVIFNQMGGEAEDKVPVSLVCMLAIDDPKQHMDTLANLMELFSDHDMLEQIKNCSDKEKIMKLLSFTDRQ